MQPNEVQVFRRVVEADRKSGELGRYHYVACPDVAISRDNEEVENDVDSDGDSRGIHNDALQIYRRQRRGEHEIEK